MSDKISVVTVTYNCEGIIRETIESVLKQIYENLEYIIVDGASKDKTLDIANEYKSQISKIVSEPDKGIYDAMNKALKIASGDWIIFMNAGDVFYNPQVIADCFKDSHSDCAAVFGSWYRKRKSEMLLCDCNKPFYENSSKFKTMGFSHQSVFVKLDWAKRFPFDLSFKLCADYNMIYQIYQNGGKFYNTHLPICIFDATEGASQKYRVLQYKEHGRVLGIENTIYFKIRYAYFKFKQDVKRIIHRQ